MALETSCLTAWELQKLETFHVKKLRIMMTGAAARQTNTWVRRACHTHTITSQLIAERIHWLKSMLKDPTHNAA
eukprot:640582-Heterocapsa_arctica.AAC.1